MRSPVRRCTHPTCVTTPIMSPHNKLNLYIDRAVREVYLCYKDIPAFFTRTVQGCVQIDRIVVWPCVIRPFEIRSALLLCLWTLELRYYWPRLWLNVKWDHVSGIYNSINTVFIYADEMASVMSVTDFGATIMHSRDLWISPRSGCILREDWVGWGSIYYSYCSPYCRTSFEIWGAW